MMFPATRPSPWRQRVEPASISFHRKLNGMTRMCRYKSPGAWNSIQGPRMLSGSWRRTFPNWVHIPMSNSFWGFSESLDWKASKTLLAWDDFSKHWCFSDFITYIPRSKSTIRMLISKDGGFSTPRYLSIEKAVQSWHERNWHSYNELMWIHLHRCYIPCPNPFILSINWLDFRRVFDKSLADTSGPTTMWLCRFQGKKNGLICQVCCDWLDVFHHFMEEKGWYTGSIHTIRLLGLASSTCFCCMAFFLKIDG